MSRDGAAHKITRRSNFEFAIEKANLRFAFEAEELFDPVHVGPWKAAPISLALLECEIANWRDGVKGCELKHRSG